MEQVSDIPQILPILPSKSALVYPTAAAILKIENETAFRLLDDIKDAHRLLVIAAQKSPEKEPTRLSDLFRVGTVARLGQMSPITDGKREIFVLGLERVVIGELVQEKPYFLAKLALKPDLEMQEDISTDDVSKAISAFRMLIARSQKMPEQEVTPHFEHKTLREKVYTMAFFAGVDIKYGQQLLEFDIVKARLSRLREYLTSEQERFDQEWQAAQNHVQQQGQATRKLEIALDALNTAATLKDTFQVLKREKSLLLKKQALDALRSRIAQKRQQKASIRWIFLLEQDLELLENVQKHGFNTAMLYLDARIKMLQNQQAVFEAIKVLASIDFNNPETIMDLLRKQEKEPFSAETFDVLHALANQAAANEPEQGKRLQILLELLESTQKYGLEEALPQLMSRFNPGFESQFEHIIDVLEEYLTSETLEEAYLILQQNQQILLSDTVHEMLEQHIADRHRVGDHQSAKKLETHLYLFDDARVRGIETAWQTFMEDE